MELKIFTTDELIVIYELIDLKINELQIYCLPNSLKEYYNQLTHIQLLIRKEINDRQKEYKNV